MRVLLINPFVERMHLELSYAENFRPPLGLAYCAAVLERHGHEVEIVDALVRGIRFPELRRILAERRPDIVGVSTYSPTRYECFRTAKVVKETLGEHIVVVAGGPHVSAAVEDTLENVPHIDYVVRGEGEYPLLELVRALETGGDPLAVAGVSGRRDGRPYDAPAQANVADLDGLPRPARHLLPMSRYGTRMPSTMVKSTTILTSRGCPARCTFCTRDWFSRDTRFHSPAYMADEIEEVIGRYGFRGVIIQDDTFTLNKRRVFEFCDELRSRKMRFRWLATTRVDCINLDLLKSMKDAGCEVVTFGVESMNPRILKWLKKGFTVEKVRRAIDWAREAGLKVRCTYLLGIGDETEQDIQQSIRDARALPVDKNSYDGAWTESVFAHIPRTDVAKAMTSVHAALRPGGLLHVRLPLGEGEGFEDSEDGQIYRARWEAAHFEEVMGSLDFTLLQTQQLPNNEVGLLFRREY
jgi:radical SAM superfamily enzyme YgiQ (UPF0313 family)